MTDEKKKSPTDEERMAECRAEVVEVLCKHRCVIVPVLSYELVGQNGNKVMLTADYAIATEREK